VISFLRGRIAASGVDWVELDVGGVGFRAAVSRQAAAALPAPGSEARLPTELVVREDGVHLFGFADEAEREAFRALTAVSGVGGRTALAVLSALRPEALARAVQTEDLAALTAVPGVGRKTAQRLVMELKDKLPEGGRAGRPGGSSGPSAGPGAASDEAAEALVALGFAPEEAARALAAADLPPEAGTVERVRAALRVLGPRTG
jgi:Holliday junction DNA helicase RuvA